MLIKGLQKTTLLDFPGRVACTVFTGGCNFRCPFCHNASLVLSPNEVEDISEDQFFSFLSKRKGILDGVCITGGEPLLQKDIIAFIEKIHSMGFLVKLDTNGSYPDKLKEIVSLNIIDYIAMDIKNSQQKYSQSAGIDKDCHECIESIKFIMSCGIDYEFRTTVIKELHTRADIEAIGNIIKGAKRYYLQKFKDSGELICQGFSAHSDEEMKALLDIATPFVDICELRGM